MATVGTALDESVARLHAGGSPSPRLDAEVLLAFVLGTDRTAILAHPEAPLGADHLRELEAFVERRAAGEPVAYLRGMKEFYGLILAVDPRVLIPRPETELLVDLGVARVVSALASAPRPAGAARLRVVDVATGSGAVAVALAATLRSRGFLEFVDILATDISTDALAVAQENVVSHAVADRVRLEDADLLPLDAPPYDLLLANLPYVPTADLPGLPVAARFEPVVALDGGPDGLGPLRRLLDRLPAALVPEGAALLEVGAAQAEAARRDAEARLSGWFIDVHPDLAGLPRVMELRPAHGPGPA